MSDTPGNKKDPAGPTKRPTPAAGPPPLPAEPPRGTHAIEPLRSRAATITNEEELEIARLRSMSMSERPTPNSSATLLSLANAYAALTGSAPPPSIPAMPATRPEEEARAIELPADLAGEMRDRFSLGDYTGALAMAEELLARDPAHVEAERCAENCRAVLQKMYAARLGPLDRVPIVAVPRDQLRWLSIDHRAGFLLSHVDGVSSLEMILDVCGMPTLDALRILHELYVQNVLTFK